MRSFRGERAQGVQLATEYDPQPPFDPGAWSKAVAAEPAAY
jgi:hypothetical protein